MSSLYDIVADAVELYRYKNNYIDEPKFNDIVKRGGYKGLQKWEMDLLKATSILFPSYNINNIFKNFSISSNTSSATFYNNQFPLNLINYLPDRKTGSQKTNITTDLFRGYELDEDVKDFTYKILNLENPYNAD